MKTILLLSMLLFNAFCMGQCIDSFNIVYRGQNGSWKVYDRNAPETYELADSLWLNYDETWIIYNYHCDSFHISNDYDVKNWSTYSDEKFTKPDIKAVLPKADFKIFNYMPDTMKLVPDFDLIFDSVTIYGNEEPVYHRKRDTVKVLLLVCDTSYFEGLGIDTSGEQTIFHLYDDKIRWREGYSVKELHSTAEEFDAGMTPKELWGTWWKNVSYLDENKKELPKNIIIWQSKEINPHN